MYSSETDMLVSAPSITKSEGRVLSEDEENNNVREWWKEEVDAAITRWWALVPEVSKAAFAEEVQMTPLGYKVLDIPYGLGLMLANQYGWGCFSDRDFITYLQKATGQTFLAKI